jgi:hypothetical protein
MGSLLWTGPRRVDSLSLMWRLSARRVARHRTSSVIPHGQPDMTKALCLSCGRTKFGAIVPCPHCGVPNCGDINVNIAFSDHRLPLAALEALGSVIRAISPHSPDPSERFWTFIEYVSQNHPKILRVDLAPDTKAKCDAILATAAIPALDLGKS